MSKRVTVMLDDDVNKKLRMVHGKWIIKSDENVSFSMVINDTLKKGLK